LGGGVRLAGDRATLALLEPLADRVAVAVALRVEAAVVRQEVGRQDVEEVVPDRAVLLGRRRLDDRRAEAAASLERVLEARGDVRVELDLADPGRDGDPHACQTRRGIRR